MAFPKIPKSGKPFSKVMSDGSEDPSITLDEIDESKETPQEETSDYAQIDEFLKSLDEDEMAYLKTRLGEEKEKEAPKVLDAKDFED